MLVSEFGKAKARIGFVLQSKLSCYESLPLKLLGLAHTDEAAAAECASQVVDQLRCLRSSLSPAEFSKLHTKIKFWSANVEALEEFASGHTTRSCLRADLQSEIGQLIFPSLNETSIEAKHALAKCRLGRRVAAHPTPQLFASELRFNEFNTRAADPHTYQAMQECFRRCMAPIDIVAEFGLQDHTFLNQKLEQGALAHSDMALALYHCDIPTQYLAHRTAQQAVERERKRRRLALKDPIDVAIAHAVANEGVNITTEHQLVWKAATEHSRKAAGDVPDAFFSCLARPGVALQTVRDRIHRVVQVPTSVVGQVPEYNLLHKPRPHLWRLSWFLCSTHCDATYHQCGRSRFPETCCHRIHLSLLPPTFGHAVEGTPRRHYAYQRRNGFRGGGGVQRAACRTSICVRIHVAQLARVMSGMAHRTLACALAHAISDSALSPSHLRHFSLRMLCFWL